MGIGYHTGKVIMWVNVLLAIIAGMQLSDRALVEDLFLNGELRVLCATTSRKYYLFAVVYSSVLVSQGVNFPGTFVFIVQQAHIN